MEHGVETVFGGDPEEYGRWAELWWALRDENDVWMVDVREDVGGTSDESLSMTRKKSIALRGVLDTVWI